MGWTQRMRKWVKRAEIMLGLPTESDDPRVPTQKEYAARFNKTLLARGVAAAIRIRKAREHAKADVPRVKGDKLVRND